MNYLIGLRAIDSVKPKSPAMSMVNAKSCFSKGISCLAVNTPLTEEVDFNKMEASYPLSIANS